MSLQTRADVVTYPQGMDTRSPRVSPRTLATAVHLHEREAPFPASCLLS